ncbi:hypothetical protein TRVL_05854 [Trypanosoma vivax]|nr:hypothetical protein TRVL_05854 [Trypanosoma vivax]
MISLQRFMHLPQLAVLLSLVFTVEATTGVSPALAHKPVSLWTVADVDHWMNYTVGYAEYSGYVRKHLIDGPTLLEMTPADFEEHFPIENSVHVIKLAAHVKLLKGICICDATISKVVDFWSYFQHHNFRVWVVGFTSVVFPRVSMLYTYFFDAELFELVVGITQSPSDVLTAAAAAGADKLPALRVVPFLHHALYLIFMLVAPDFFMAFQAMRMVPTNYFIMPCFVLHFVAQAFHECMVAILIFRGDAFPPGTNFFQKIWTLYSYAIIVPIATLVLYPFIAYSMQVVCFVALLAWLLLSSASVLISLFFRGPWVTEHSAAPRRA